MYCGTREDERGGYGREKEIWFMCIGDVTVLSTFVGCVGIVVGLGSSMKAWV